MKKILIIEDEKAIAELIKLYLEREGFGVSMAMDGVEGLEVAWRMMPDLIILDVLMPRMDGFQFYKEMKRIAQTSRIPLLVMTVRGAMRDSFEGLGVEAFLSKPFEPDELVAQVKKILTSSLPVMPSIKPSLLALIAGHDRKRIDNIRMALLVKGYRVEVASDGPDALEKAVQLRPDMFFIPYDMPELNTENAVKVLSRHPETKKTTVIVYSPLATKEELALLKAGRLISQDAKKEAAIKVDDKFDTKSFLDKINNFMP